MTRCYTTSWDLTERSGLCDATSIDTLGHLAQEDSDHFVVRTARHVHRREAHDVVIVTGPE